MLEGPSSPPVSADFPSGVVCWRLELAHLRVAMGIDRLMNTRSAIPSLNCPIQAAVIRECREAVKDVPGVVGVRPWYCNAEQQWYVCILIEERCPMERAYHELKQLRNRKGYRFHIHAVHVHFHQA